MSMRSEVLSLLFFSTVSGLLAVMVMSVWMGMSHRPNPTMFYVIIIIIIIIIIITCIIIIIYFF